VIQRNDSYLDDLDGLFAVGVQHFGPEFAGRRVEFVLSAQMPDGGFRGRRGGSDIYYTDFALRTLALLDPGASALARAAEYLDALSPEPSGVVECFNRLNCTRLLGMCEINAAVEPNPIHAQLAARREGTYHIFLAALCYQMLGVPFPDLDQTISTLNAMRCDDGGFAEQHGQDHSQTNATTAAVGFLVMHDAMPAKLRDGVVTFLTAMQQPGAGFLSHPAAPEPDLLSTFTALVTLAGLDGLGRVDLSTAARFIRKMGMDEAGFRGTLSDVEADVEYTYYGVAAAALLRAYASSS
jgi:geranylgeranyl transferase type-2 subunit beta